LLQDSTASSFVLAIILCFSEFVSLNYCMSEDIIMSSLKKSMTSSKEDGSELRRGPWTLEEDTLLVHYIGRHGEGRWNLLAKRAGIVLNPL
jgi:hypothetical protein